MFKGFKEFIMRGSVVDLAIAVVIGTAFTTLVKAFVADILTPIIAAIVGQPNFENLTFTINHSHFLYGDLINAAVTFASVAAAVYYIVVVPLNKLAERRARGQAPAPEEVPPDIALLSEIRDLLAGKAEPPAGS
ncbi:MAG TPA: large conductance mechanosensitive channel protein MscL [Acidimicrobiales bacterium]|nr:large conductance mechanosensitive channel protein MscL [Acidimicrobiales bacterium]HUB71167.1 large conductance mechanosensitive channel protein MscL [Acidimicrobiales bacterium]